jgi:inorganic pyrophosphatase
MAGSSHVHTVVEIPAGTADKWVVTDDGGALVIERAGGTPRRIDYLPYPANYGFIPRTLSDPKTGGDGDPLDVILLGPAVPCGTVARARILGALRLIDDGERDDKILAVRPDSPLGDAAGIRGLRERYPGVLKILGTWFVRYEGPGNRSRGFLTAGEAWSIVSEAASAYAETQPASPDR